jgi:hypothetical protein
LDYAIEITRIPVTKSGLGSTPGIITADILIVLPLYFEAEADDPDTTEIERAIEIDSQRYVKVKVEMLEDMLDGLEGDLLDSVRPTLDDFAKITKLNMDIKLENDISNDFFFGIETGGDWQALPLRNGVNTSLSLSNSEINPKLELSFAILVEEGTSGSNKGTLKLKPFGANAGLDVKITAGAKIDVDATL